MDINVLIAFWVMVAVAAAILAGGVFIYQRLILARVGASPSAQQALDALAYWVGLAIFAGEKVAVNAFDQAEAYIASADKKAVADSLYDIIPPVITLGKLTLSTDLVKRLVPREEWQRLVEDAYNKADAILQAHEQFLKDQVKSLPPLTPNPTMKTNTVGRSLYGVDGDVYSEIKDFADANPVPEPKG